ncbi:MAG: hypothetical protein ACLUVV_00150 [Christensenellales bacterium]
MTNSKTTAYSARRTRQAGRRKKQRNLWQLWIALGLAIIILALLALVGYPYAKKLAYPLKYEAYITEYAEANGLDPYLVCGVIHTESHFDEAEPRRVACRSRIPRMDCQKDVDKGITAKRN